jgi:hypothetical protein
VDNSEGDEVAGLLMVPFRVRIGADRLRLVYFGFVRLEPQQQKKTQKKKKKQNRN